MSILNVNKINPVGGGSTITIAGITSVTSSISIASSCTATSYYGNGANLTGIDLGAVTGATGDFSIADKIVHTGDTNTAIRFPAADTITSETGGSERLRIDSGGNTNFGAEKSVALPSGTGIQVYHSANPRIKLVNDTTGNGSTDGTQIYLSSDGDTIIDNKDSEDIIIHSNASEKLRIGTSGQIGIAGANYGTSGQVLKSQGASSAVQWASPSLAMADQWRVSTSQTTSSDTIADITGWSRNNNNFAGVGGALTNSGANFTFPSTGIYYISYNIATYITSGSSRYISARLYFAGQDICHSWASSYHASGNQTTQSTGSQAIINVTNASTQTFKIRIQSQNPVVVVGLNEAGYNSSVNMSEVVVMRIG